MLTNVFNLSEFQLPTSKTVGDFTLKCTKLLGYYTLYGTTWCVTHVAAFSASMLNTLANKLENSLTRQLIAIEALRKNKVFGEESEQQKQQSFDFSAAPKETAKESTDSAEEQDKTDLPPAREFVSELEEKLKSDS